jgi:hypothetical protein
LIDQNAIAALVQQQITEAVKNQISLLLADPDWIDRIEKRAVDQLANRIESRFTRLNEDPELSQAVHSGVRSLFEHGYVPDITRYVDSKKFQQSVDTGVQNAVTDVIANLSLDPIWLTRVETMVNQQMHVKVNKYISEVRIEQTVADAFDGALDRWLENNPGIRTNGIDDQAQHTELTVMDGTVVIEGELAASRVSIVNDAVIQGNLTVGDLDITGGIKVTEPAWNQISARAADLALTNLTQEWRQSLINEIAEQIKSRGMNLDQVLINDQPLITDGGLNSSIQHSNLQTVGILKELSVATEISVGGDTAPVTIGSRDGIAWIGSNTKSLVFGTADQPQITMGIDGVTAVNQLKIGDMRIGFAAQVPGYRGQRGDIVFNSDPTPGTPFAWQCLGAFNWQSIRGAQ